VSKSRLQLCPCCHNYSLWSVRTGPGYAGWRGYECDICGLFKKESIGVLWERGKEFMVELQEVQAGFEWAKKN